jgi:hypothetical protein
MRAQGQRSAQLASIQVALTSQTAATMGAATTQRMIIQATGGFQKSSTAADVSRGIRETDIGASREVSNIVAGAERDLSMTRGNASVGKIEKAMEVTESAIPSDAPLLRGVVSWPKVTAVDAHRDVATNATTQYSRDMVQNQETIAKRVIYSSQQYQTEMNKAIDRQAGAQVAGVNAGAGEAIAGYRRGATQARVGVEQNYGKELDANKTVYVNQVNAAGQIRNAGLEAAKLRQAAAVVAQVGREISREVGQGMRIRF